MKSTLIFVFLLLREVNANYLVETPDAGIDQLVKNGDVNDSLHEGFFFLRRQLEANTPSASPSLSHSPSPSTVTVLTTLNATNIAKRIMFDVTALADVTIESFKIHIGDKLQTGVRARGIQLWTKSGTHVGSETSRRGWSRLRMNTLINQGNGTYTDLDFNFRQFRSVEIPASTTRAFYFVYRKGFYASEGTSVGTISSVENDYIEIKEGTVLKSARTVDSWVGLWNGGFVLKPGIND
mmetsp:Transcript_20618/g.25306  ORF Transcript_20618/g.25306 Transcript_20618/m.25306 type:complete len:238 (-) Transcript_20618:382-1095(-)